MSQFSRPLVVFDLDETLIYCNEKPYRDAQITTRHGHLSIRDGLEDMLEKVSDVYDIMVWSTSGKEYIDDMLTIIWPSHIPLVDVFTSAECGIKSFENVGVPHYKDMRKIIKKHPCYTLDRIAGVDDTPDKYKRNFGNLVSVSRFTGAQDNELTRLGDYLVTLSLASSIRKVEKRYWRRVDQEKASGDPTNSNWP